jgi:hypothetical protein
MTLCWTANSDINNKLTMMARNGGPAGPESIVFGTTNPVTKPIE